MLDRAYQPDYGVPYQSPTFNPYGNKNSHPQYPLHPTNYYQGEYYPNQQIPNQPLSSNESQNNPSNNAYMQNIPNNHMYQPDQNNFDNPSNMPGFSMSPLIDHSIDIKGLGNYPDEWMHAMPEPGKYVEMPVNMPYENAQQFVNSPMGVPGNEVYQDDMYNMPMEGQQMEMPGNPEMNGMMPNMYANQYQDDCLFMNLEEEYLHKVSLQNKKDGQMENNQ